MDPEKSWFLSSFHPSFWQPNWCEVSHSHRITPRAGRLYESCCLVCAAFVASVATFLHLGRAVNRQPCFSRGVTRRAFLPMRVSHLVHKQIPSKNSNPHRQTIFFEKMTSSKQQLKNTNVQKNIKTTQKWCPTCAERSCCSLNKNNKQKHKSSE